MTCPSCQGENDDAAEVCFHCRAVLLPVTRGAVLAGRYEIVGVLGRGGMGTVYRAHDRVLDEAVALKLLRADLARDPEHARRFRAEIKLARRVSHPHVCRIHDYGEDQGFHFIGMELIEGSDLKRLLQTPDGLPVGDAFDVAVQAADGLDAIHVAGIVHRDLKTANIMRDAHGAVKLMDFGIAKRTGPDATPGATATGQIVGTPEYMSPEQARGQKADFRSDVYALGAVVYETFTGRVPFKGESPVATMYMHTHTPPPLDGLEAARLPRAVVPVLRKALAKDPRDRYPSGREFARALRGAREAFARGEGGREDGLEGPTLSLAGSRRPGTWIAVAAGAAAVVVFLAGRPRTSPAPWLPSPPRVLPAPAPRPADTDVAVLREEPPTPVPARTMRPLPPPVAAATRAVTMMPAQPPTSAPSPPPTAEPAVTATSAPPSPPPAAVEERGVLQVVVVPFAEVTIDDEPRGMVSSTRFSLAAGPHLVVVSHPDYQPLRRKVTLLAGATEKLVVDLAEDAIRKKK